MQFAIRAAGEELFRDVAVHTLDAQREACGLGVTLAPTSQARGLATRALTAVIDHLFEAHGGHRVIAQCDARNDAVKRLLGRSAARGGSRRESYSPGRSPARVA